MKVKGQTLLIIPSLLLSGCTFFGVVKSNEKELRVIDLDRMGLDDDLTVGEVTSVKARFKKGEDMLPYLTLSQYASIFDSHLEEGFKSEIQNTRYRTTWTLSNSEAYYFYAEINFNKKIITYSGSIDSCYKADDYPLDTYALNYGLKSEYDGKFLGDTSFVTIDYSSYGFETFVNNGECYFPLGLLDITFSGTTSITVSYNYKHVFSTYNVDFYSERTFRDGDDQIWTFDSQMNNCKTASSLPNYLRDYNANLFLYLMDNFYGLKKEKGIDSAKLFYKRNGIYSELFSYSSLKRAQAYADALAILDDNHTVLYNANTTWGEEDFIHRRYGEGIASRNATRDALSQYRPAYYSAYSTSHGKQYTPGVDAIYSDDGQTAMFMFDSFTFASNSQFRQEDAYLYDAYLGVTRALKQIKSVGTVKNVILDISTNGGGTIGVMMKLLSLLSKDNSSSIYYYEDTSSQLGIATSKVDSNDDGEYDSRDCFGNIFDFYILTSDCSFSCGNAFPCYAQKEGLAKIIGQKSGGGECAVAIHYLPNSQYVYHSSNLHLGYYDEATDTFTGFEKGATPDIVVPVNEDFYNIEVLNQAILNHAN